MVLSYPVHKLDAIHELMSYTHTKHFRPIPVVDSVRAKASARKRKKESELLNPILTAVYPFLSAGLEWTRPYNLMCVNSVHSSMHSVKYLKLSTSHRTFV